VTDLSIFSIKWERQFLQMLVDHVLECGIEKVLKRRTKYNRSLFQSVISKRADGNPNTMAFVGSPELVTAMAIAGDLDSIH
jgi:hypothetical protein